MARVLIVENEFLQQAFLSNVLGPEGHTVFQASSPEQAVEAAKTELPDVVILDFRLSDDGEDGIVVAERILKVHPCAVIFLTGYYGAETTARMLTVSPVAILEKPPHPDRIIEAVALAAKMPTQTPGHTPAAEAIP